MAQGVAQAGRWKISTRPSGEVLIGRHEEADLLMVLVGSPGTMTSARMDLMLAQIARDSRDAAERVTGHSVVPPLLHQVLARMVTGPLAEGEDDVAALVVMDDGHDAALGWAGKLEHLVVSDDSASVPSWIRLRDGSGREARACVFPINAPAEMVFSWPAGGVDPASPSLFLDVVRDAPESWHGLSDDPTDVQAVLARMIAVRRGTEPVSPQPVTASPAGAAPAPAAPMPDAIPPTPEPEWLTRHAIDPIEETYEEPVESAVAAPAQDWDDADSRATDAEAASTPEYDAETATPGPVLVRTQAQTDPAAEPWRAPVPMRPAWPSIRELEAKPLWRRPWVWAVVGAVLLAGAGWLALRPHDASKPAPLAGFGGRVSFTIDSTPGSAEILVDGRETGQRTPTTLALKPGDHKVTLRVPGLGEADYAVRAVPGEAGNLMAILSGTVRVTSNDSQVPVTVTFDGVERGYTPITLNEVAPGPHELRFRAPGMEPWTETFELGIGEEREVVTQPFHVPDTGILEVRATHEGDPDASPVHGASVYVDGELRGRTPFELELPRGPHSIRVTHAGQEPPVQVLELPGGNRRFADFVIGGGAETPRLTRIAPNGPMSRDLPTILAIAISGMTEGDIREMWLHVRTPEGIWRRFPMELRRASGALVGSTVFPIALIDEYGHATYYVSAMTPVGDEYFTELVTPVSRRGARAKAAPKPAASESESESDTP